MATFTYQLGKEEVHLDMHFDREDLLKVVGAENPKAIETYILAHSSSSISGVPLHWQWVSIQHRADHINILAIAAQPVDPNGKIRIKNTCLIREIGGHSNLIFVETDSQRRGFRLNKNRTEVSLTMQ